MTEEPKKGSRKEYDPIMRVRTALSFLGISLLLLSQVEHSQPDRADSEIRPGPPPRSADARVRPSPRVRLAGTVFISLCLGLVAFGAVTSFRGPAAGLIAVTATGAGLVAYGGFAQIYSHMHRDTAPEIAQEWKLSALVGFGMGGLMLAAEPVVKLLIILFGPAFSD